MGPLTDLPAELVAGWCLWFLGGLGLLIWFWRASAPRMAAPPPPVVIRQSGVRSSGVRQSGVRQSGVRPPKPSPDAFTELQGLLEPDGSGTGTVTSKTPQ
jgi:hypothetical protein